MMMMMTDDDDNDDDDESIHLVFQCCILHGCLLTYLGICLGGKSILMGERVDLRSNRIIVKHV